MLLLPATLTASDAREVLRMLSQALLRETGGLVTVDAGGLQHFDSSALAVLLECERLAQANGRSFTVRQAPPKLAALAKLYGVDALLWADEPASAEIIGNSS